jgi:hypothetical protein
MNEDTAPEVCDALDSTPPMHGPVDVFNAKHRGVYNQMVADSLDDTLSEKQRQNKKDIAAAKLKRAISKRMEDDGDPDAKAAHDKLREKDRVRMSLFDADAKRKRDAGDKKALAAYAIKKGQSSAWQETKRQAIHDERAAAYVKNGGSTKSTEFGLGEESREDEIDSRADALLDSPAGSLCPHGKDTEKRWVEDHGENTTIREVLLRGLWAICFIYTSTIRENGDENKCPETTHFMVGTTRDPIWRKEGVDDDNNRDLPRLGRDEVTSVGYVYKVDERVSPYDATSVEGGLQKNIEEKLNMPHGRCLHREAGAGSRKEYSTTPNEKKALAAGQKLTYSVVMTMIPITNPVYADVDPSDPERAPPLLSCTVTSHDGRNTQYRIVVRGDKQGFPETKSVRKDNAAIAVKNAKRVKRHRNDKKKAKKSDTALEAEEMCEDPEEIPANSDESPMSDGGGSSDSDEDMGTDSEVSQTGDDGESIDEE